MSRTPGSADVPPKAALDAGTDQTMAWFRDVRAALWGDTGDFYTGLADGMAALIAEQFPGQPAAGRIVMAAVQALTGIAANLPPAVRSAPEVLLAIGAVAAGQLDRQAPQVPPGRYAQGGRSPIVWVLLCPPCAGYAASRITFTQADPPYGQCQGCGGHVTQLHRFMAVINSAAGCNCLNNHPAVTGDLPGSAGRHAWTLTPPTGDDPGPLEPM